MFKCLHCTLTISWLGTDVYVYRLLIVINSIQMYVDVKRQNVHCYFVVFVYVKEKSNYS